MPDLYLRKDDLKQMKQYTEEWTTGYLLIEIPFSLLTRIRCVRAFCSPRFCRLYNMTCPLAFIMRVQCSDALVELVSIFANEPEYTNELIRTVRSEESVSGISEHMQCLPWELN